MRTSKFKICIRATLIVFLIYMALAWAWNSITNTNFWTPLEMFISAVLSVVIFGGLLGLVVRLVAGLIYGRDPDYRQWLDDGGDPFFAVLPWPFHPDSQLTRETGIQEPSTSVVPPADWQYQCPSCGARVQRRIDVCWNCSYGSNGDSTVYFERYGVEFRPPEILPDEWERIRRRHGR